MATIVWIIVAALLCIAFIVRIVTDSHAARRNRLQHVRRRHTTKFIELGKENEEFFIPGDKANGSRYDYYD